MKSIVQPDGDQCYLCGRKTNLECHHILGGIANRRLSSKFGLTVTLCADCHRGADGAQYAKDLNRLLKQQAQIAFEEIYGHDKWMETFKKNYL